MLHLLGRLFGNRDDDAKASSASHHVSTLGSGATFHAYQDTDLYYFKSRGMQYAISKRDFERAGVLARESLKYVAGFVSETLNSYGIFDIRSIPPLEQGGRILALVGDEDGLSQLEGVVSAISELEPWKAKTAEHWEDLRLFNLIKGHLYDPILIAFRPKSDIFVEHDNGHRIATLISYLEKDRKIQRIPEGKTTDWLA